MKQRSLLKMFLLEIVTLGIYRLYFLVKTRREIMSLKPEVKIKSPAFLFVPIALSIAAFVFVIVSFIASVPTAKNCDSVAATQTSQSSDLFNTSTDKTCSKPTALPLIAILVLYLAIPITLVLFIVWEWSYSHGVEAVTGAKLSFALSLIILILVPDGIDILILQDYFNKVVLLPEGGIAPVAPMAPVLQPAPIAPTQPPVA